LRKGVGGSRCPGRLAVWAARDNTRRRAKQRSSGRQTSHWVKLKKQAKEAAGYQCQACGRAEIPDSRGWLSVHLRPDYQGEHRMATLEDVVVLCLPCHGKVDRARFLQAGVPPAGEQIACPRLRHPRNKRLNRMVERKQARPAWPRITCGSHGDRRELGFAFRSSGGFGRARLGGGWVVEEDCVGREALLIVRSAVGCSLELAQCSTRDAF
jgi:5-methylcytosine-specific restriction endonuclease McrA